MNEQQNDLKAPRRLARGKTLRARWDNMPLSTFNDHVKNGVIPKPMYPFGRAVPYWDLDEIEALEQRAKAETLHRLVGTEVSA